MKQEVDEEGEDVEVREKRQERGEERCRTRQKRGVTCRFERGRDR